MKRTVKASALCLAALLAGSPGRAASNAGSDPFDFLFIDANARAAALGGAYTALAADSNALLYNPAGLGRVPRHEATFMHNRYVEGVSQEYFSVASRYGLGASVNFLSFGEIPRTTVSQPAGTGSSFGLTDLAVTGGYGKDIGGGLALGGAYKYIREHVDDVSATAHAFDAGLLWAVPWVAKLRLGASVQNMGGKVRFQRAREDLPLSGRVGAAYAFDWGGRATTVSFDGFGQRYGRVQFGFGGETILGGVMALRAGYTSRNETDMGLTAGAGWIIHDLSVDYAVVPFGDFDLAHRLSVTFRWGKERPKEAPATVKAKKEQPKPVQAGSFESRLERSRTFMEDGRFTKARGELEKARKLLEEGDNRVVLLSERLGRIAWQEEDYPKAKAGYSEAIRLAGELGMEAPGVSDAFLGMGLCLLQENSPEYAAKFLRRVVDLAPESAQAKEARRKLAKIEKEAKKEE